MAVCHWSPYLALNCEGLIFSLSHKYNKNLQRKDMAISKPRSFVSDDGRAWNSLTPEQFQLMEDYLNQDWDQLTLNGKSPTIAGMAVAAGAVVSAIHENRRKYKILDYLINRCLTLQQMYLQDHGLSGHYNSNIARVLLANQGITDKVTVDNTSSDGSMTPQQPALSHDELKELISKALDKI